MAVKHVQYRGNLGSPQTDRYRSPGIWHNVNVAVLQENPTFGTYMFDDFRWAPVLTTPTITTEALYARGYKAFGSAGGTIVPAALSRGGGLTFTETDDNQGFSLATIARPFRIARTYGRFAFECRLKVNNITDLDTNLFVGLGDSMTLSATVPITATGTLADENLVGHFRTEADGDQFDTVYKADGVTAVTVGSDVLTTGNNTTAALVADTYIKLGMKFEPFGVHGANYLTFYVNGIELADKKQIPSAAGTDFPNDVDLGFVIAGLCGSNNDSIVTLDWWEAAQEFAY